MSRNIIIPLILNTCSLLHSAEIFGRVIGVHYLEWLVGECGVASVSVQLWWDSFAANWNSSSENQKAPLEMWKATPQHKHRVCTYVCYLEKVFAALLRSLIRSSIA